MRPASTVVPVLAWAFGLQIGVAVLPSACAHAAAQAPAAQAPALPTDPAARREWLRTQLDGFFSIPAFAQTKVSVLVAELESGKPIYTRNEHAPLNVASNVKLITSAAALAKLGPEFRWKTSVLGPVNKASGRWLGPGGELAGDLYLRGTGDPTLSTQDLGELASELLALGVRKVRGGVVVDASAFDAANLGPAYEQKAESAAFRSASSAASLNSNAVVVTIIPAATAGAAARVVIEPSSPYFVTSGRVTTAKTGPSIPLVETSDAGNGQTRVTVTGRIRIGSEPRTVSRRIVHPELYLGNTFRQILQRRGVTVDKPVRVEPVPADGFRALATHDGPPLAVVVHDLNKRSSNFAAEQVLRTLGGESLGRPGTWEKGLEASAMYLDGIGIKRKTYQMANGSGLYDSNRFSAEQVVLVLRAALRDFRIGSEYLASLSVAGADGTLAQRMGGTAAERFVRAKTGTLANVSCMSGVAGAPGQKPLLFSILMNDLSNGNEGRAAQDKAAEAIVQYLDTRPPGPR